MPRGCSLASRERLAVSVGLPHGSASVGIYPLGEQRPGGAYLARTGAKASLKKICVGCREGDDAEALGWIVCFLPEAWLREKMGLLEDTGLLQCRQSQGICLHGGAAYHPHSSLPVGLGSI